MKLNPSATIYSEYERNLKESYKRFQLLKMDLLSIIHRKLTEQMYDSPSFNKLYLLDKKLNRKKKMENAIPMLFNAFHLRRFSENLHHVYSQTIFSLHKLIREYEHLKHKLQSSVKKFKIMTQAQNKIARLIGSYLPSESKKQFQIAVPTQHYYTLQDKRVPLTEGQLNKITGMLIHVYSEQEEDEEGNPPFTYDQLLPSEIQRVKRLLRENVYINARQIKTLITPILGTEMRTFRISKQDPVIIPYLMENIYDDHYLQGRLESLFDQFMDRIYNTE